jgi:hypothetical protein
MSEPNEVAPDPGLSAFIAENQARLGTGVEAIAFALKIEDHYDMRAFLESWLEGDLSVWTEFDARIEDCKPAADPYEQGYPG